MEIKSVLDKVPSHDLPELMLYLEQRAKCEADLRMLRALKDYRRMLEELGR